MNSEIAKEFAWIKHFGQKDDNGVGYFLGHVCQVAEIVKLITSDDELISVAYLHDTLEDTNTTYEELENLFGKKIADLVNELTHEGKKDTFGYYFPRLKSKEAILVKFADRLSNLSRMQSWDEDRQLQYIKKSKFWKTSIGE